MQYMLLIYSVETEAPAESSAEMGKYLQAYRAFSEDARAAKVLVAGNPLEGVRTATTVRVRGGQTETIDGPFAETKEQLAGYYLLECENLDKALEYAAKCPAASYGSVEVRPIRVFQRPG